MTLQHIAIGSAVAVAAAALILAVGMQLFYARYYGFETRPSTPEAEGLPGVSIASFPSEDGRTIRAWVAPPAEGRPVILYFPGNYTSVGPSAGRMRPFLDAGFGVAVLEYRGSSGSTETPSEANFARDARALYDRLDSLLGAAIPPERRVIHGFSLGSAVGARLAAERPVGAVVLEASFPQVCNYFQRRYGGIPFCRLMWKDRFEVITRIGQVAAPKLFVHGERDAAVPVAWGRRLFEAAPEPKAFIAYPSGEHANLLARGMAADVIAFLDRAIPRAR